MRIPFNPAVPQVAPAQTPAPAAIPEHGSALKKVSVITVNFNQPLVTEALLHSIAATNEYPAIEVIVVDNGSDANPVPDWTLQFPDVRFLRSESNLGFAGGNNLGLAAASGELLFLVNNDTEFTPGLVRSMVDYMEADPGIGIASPKIRYYDQPELIQYSGFTPMNNYTGRNACIGQHERDLGQYDAQSGETGFVHGAAMMLRREALVAAGPMPEMYFLYYEEMDWCEAIRRAGFTVHVNTRALIYHKESVSVGKHTPLKTYFMNRNRILYIRRNAPWSKAAVFYGYFLAIVAPRNLLRYMRSPAPGFVSAFFKGLFWHLRHHANSTDTGYPVSQPIPTI